MTGAEDGNGAGIETDGKGFRLDPATWSSGLDASKMHIQERLEKFEIKKRILLLSMATAG